MSNLNKIIALILFVADYIKAVMLKKKKEDLKDAANESLEKNDQRPLESELGVSDSSHTQYDGMYYRKKKDKA